MSAIQVLHDFTFTYEKGTVWGTATGSAPAGIPTENMEINIEPIAHEVMRAYGFRGTVEDNRWQESSLSIPTANFVGPVVPQLMKDLLPCLLQSSASYSPAGSVYTMFTKNYSALPNPANGEGTFVTLVRNSPIAGQDVVLNSAVVKSLKLTCDVKNDNAVLNGTWDFIGKGYSKSATQAGTITNIPLTNMYRFSNLGLAELDGSSLLSSLVSFEINITNNAKFVNDLPVGGVVFPKWEVTGNFKVIANSATQGFKDLVLASNPSTSKELNFSFGDAAVTSAGEMNITSQVYLTKYTSDYAEGEVITFDFAGVFDAASTKFPIEFSFYA